MFNAQTTTQQIINFIKEYYEANNAKGAVIGISGGKDSAVVAGLFVKALGSENVIGVTLPCMSKEQDAKDAMIVANHYGFKLLNIDLSDTYNAFKVEFDFEIGIKELKDSDINLKPRLRMASLYYLAQAISSSRKELYLVAGTSNYSESYVGYFTKGGDNVSDISVLGNLLVSEVIKVGEVVGVPKEILYKAPSDGLSNQTDEEKLGVLYSDIEEYLTTGQNKNAEKIKKLNRNSLHKFKTPTYIKE